MDDHLDFLNERSERLVAVPQNQVLQQSAESFLVESIKSNYSYNFDWLGLPVIQYPQDLVAMQEIIWSTQPDCIIETGIARGGSLIFYASMLELLGKNGKVIGIDIDIREHNKERILAHPMAHRIQMIEGSSIDSATLDQVRQQVSGYSRIMLCLDSNHTHDHVLKELDLYTPFVSQGCYCVVFDTMIDLMPSGYFSERPWNKGDSPGSAIQAFLKQQEASQVLGEDKERLSFVVDRTRDAQLLVSACRGGYLKRKSVHD